MRITLTIDDDVHRAAKREAQREGTTIGAVLSRWAALGAEPPQVVSPSSPEIDRVVEEDRNLTNRK